ncbi:MAG: carboxypeptidase-like regulatory domain-containing protein [Bryobacteraceae bacterium]
MFRSWILAFAAAPTALGCTCANFTACDLVLRDVLFIGDVIDPGVKPSQISQSSSRPARFRVTEAFRGVRKGDTIDLQLAADLGPCTSGSYFEGRSYLVVPHAPGGGKYEDVRCMAQTDVAGHGRLIQQIQEHFAASSPHILGFVWFVRSHSVGPGALVTALGKGKLYSGRTRDDGSFRIDVLEPGTYYTTVLHPPFALSTQIWRRPWTAGPIRATEVNELGCGIENFELIATSSIRGTVLDGASRPMPGALVGLIDLDRPASPAPRGQWVQEVTANPRTGAFHFRNVPPGKYLAQYIPGERPFEPVYYPDSATRAGAKVITIARDGARIAGINIAAGKRAPMRYIKIHPRWLDGEPMATAEFTVFGSGDHSDDRWRPYSVHPDGAAPKDDPTSPPGIGFWAPASRTIHIKVKDRYGRPLKERYALEIPPGPGHVTREIVVESLAR